MNARPEDAHPSYSLLFKLFTEKFKLNAQQKSDIRYQNSHCSKDVLEYERKKLIHINQKSVICSFSRWYMTSDYPVRYAPRNAGIKRISLVERCNSCTLQQSYTILYVHKFTQVHTILVSPSLHLRTQNLPLYRLLLCHGNPSVCSDSSLSECSCEWFVKKQEHEEFLPLLFPYTLLHAVSLVLVHFL